MARACIRTDPKAQMMPPNKAKHGEVCCIWFCTLFIPFAGPGIGAVVLAIANIQNYVVKKKFELARSREKEQGHAVRDG